MTSALCWTVRIRPERSLLEIETTLDLRGGEFFFLPAWIPGSYLVREFVRGMQDLQATTADGTEVALERLDKATWRVRLERPQPVRIRYAIYGHELSVRAAHIDTTHAFFNGANVFVCFERFADTPQHIAIEAPDNWTSFVSLPTRDGTFVAEDYVLLADTAFEIGPHPHHSFAIDGIEHRLIYWGGEALITDPAALEDDIRALIAQNRSTFASPLPYPRYDLIFHITDEARGGLEHRNGTTLATPWAYFEDPARRADLLSLIAHEHFHSYNGRRLTPASLHPVDFRKENYTRELWVIEGFTSYFDELNTLRAGRMTDAQWLKRTSSAFNRLYRTFGRLRQPLTDASYDAWIRLYRPYEHTRNQTVSYYLKGSLVALALDLRMRAQTGGEIGLEHVLRKLWARWMQEAHAYTTDEVFAAIQALVGEEIAQEARRWVTTTAPPPYADLLRTHGMDWVETVDGKLDPGFALRPAADEPVVASIDEARCADVGALMAGDEIVAIDGRRVRSATIQDRLAACAKNASASTHLFTVFRLGRERHIELSIRSRNAVHLRFAEDSPAGARALRARLFAGPTH